MTFMAKNKKFIKEMLLISFIGILINLFCLFIYYVPVHAADSAHPLPFIVNNNVDLFNSYENQITSGSYSQGASLNNDGVIGWFAWESNYYVQHFMIPVHDNYSDFYSISYNTGDYDNFDVVFDRLTIDFSGGGTSSSDFANRKYIHVYFKQRISNTTGGSFDITKQATALSKSFGFHASNFYSINYLTSPLYDSDGNVVFTLAGSDVDGTGFATRPNWGENRQHYEQGDTSPTSVPQPPTTNNYSWTVYNPPSIDNTDVLTALEDIGDLIHYNWEYFKDNLHGEFGVITNNIESYFHYVGSTVEYYGNLLNDTIQAFGDNIYDNFVSLFEPMYENLDYFTQPLDTTAVQTALNQTTFYSLFTVGGSFKTTFQDYFDSIPQLDSLSFSIPYTILTKSGYVNIDFSWYPSIRNDIVPWIVGFLYAGFGLAIFRSIPSIIHGVSGVLQKGG